MCPYQYVLEWEGEKRLLTSRTSVGRGKRSSWQAWVGFLVLVVVALAAVAGLAQEEPTTRGTIQGTVIDDSGSPVEAASVVAYSRATDTQATLKTDKAGKYETGPLAAGVYSIRIEARNFRMSRFSLTVRDGQTTNGDRKLVPIEPGGPAMESAIETS